MVLSPLPFALRPRATAVLVRGMGVLALCALPAAALALGLGPAHGVQHVGQPLYVEVQLQSADVASADCFAAQPVPGDETYFMRGLQLALEGRPLARRLVVRSVAAINEPMVSFRIEARCDGLIARDYVLIANPPRDLRGSATEHLPLTRSQPQPARAATAPAVNALATRSAPQAPRKRVIQRATTLNAMARALYPEDRAARDRYRAAIAAANPELFAAVEHVGALPLPAGTELLLPPDNRVAETNPLPKAAAKPRVAASDRLAIGINEGPFKRLADAILRLEQIQSDRQQREGELVNALANAVSGIVELRDQVKAQDAQLAALAKQQHAAEIESRQAREAMPGLPALFALIVVAGAMGAGLMGLHHHLALRRRATRDIPAPAQSDSEQVAYRHPQRDASQSAAVPVASAAMSPAAPTPEPAPPAHPEEPAQELGLDDLMNSFHLQASQVVAAIEHLRISNSRDPADWLKLLRSARSAGLLNDSSVAAMNAQFRELFNISLEPPGDGSLETFTRVMAGIRQDWGRSACLDRLVHLIYDDRDGLRRGFPEAVADELIFLRDVLLVRLAMFGEETAPPWTPPETAVHSDVGVPANPDLERAATRAAEREFSNSGFTRET